MKKLFVYLKQYLKESILAPLFKLIEALFELFVPLIVADIIDSGIANQDKEYIISRGIFMALLGIIGFGCAVTAQYFAAKAAVSVAADMRKALYSKISKFTFTDLDKIGTATLITRMTSDTNQVQTGVNIALRLLLRSPFIVFGAMIMAFTVDVKSALIFAVTIPVITLIVVFVMTVTVPLYKKNQQKLDTILLKTRESLKGVRVIRAFCKEQSEINNFNKNNDNLTASQKKVGRISSLMNPLTYVTINGAIIAIIWVGGIRVNSGELSQGQIVALYNYMSQILVELIKLANMIITINKALASVSRIDRVLSHNNHIYTPAVPCNNDGYICFNNVGFKYENAADNSLYGINLTINKGEHIGIIGATGSGKSTLVNLIPKFYCCTDGSVTLNGKDIKEYSDIELRSKIGIAMQNSILFKGTFRDNLLLGDKKATDEQLLTALKNAQALDIVTAKGGLDGNILQNGRNLSGGQKQRLCIARALVGDPEILILDDSFSALDFATEANLRKAIASLPYNPTVFTVSQRVSSVMNSDKIIVMNDGFAVGIGTHEELIKCCLEYTEICRTQLKEEI